jgi:hypothetical protein
MHPSPHSRNGSNAGSMKRMGGRLCQTAHRQFKPGYGRKVVSIDCFVPMNRFPTNGNTCDKILSVPAWSPIQMIGHTNSRPPDPNCNCRASVSDAITSGRRFTETPYKFGSDVRLTSPARRGIPRTTSRRRRNPGSSGSPTRSRNIHPARARRCRDQDRNVPRPILAAHR